MTFFSHRGKDRSSDFDVDVRDGDGALDALIIFLLIGFACGVWFLCGTVRPALYETNPSLMAHPGSAYLTIVAEESPRASR